METSGNSTQLSFEELSGCFPGAFLVSRSASPENGKVQRMTATCGLRCIELLTRFDRVGWWARMFSACLIGEGEWSSSRCRLTWKLQGTRYGRIFCQLRVSARRIGGTGSGLLPTPVAMDGEGIQQLRTSAVEGMKKGWKASMTLTNYLVLGFLPTPVAMDAKGGCTRKELKRQASGLANVIHGAVGIPGKTSQLNPLFVLEMMGFPADWTALPFLPGAINPFGEQGTP
ncbi:MAG TPA: hypothetical protein VFE32_21660 [Puia sp.]|nr:hypothetical protein [Puia sp.]